MEKIETILVKDRQHQKEQGEVMIELTIKRPTGQTEQVKTKFQAMTEIMFEKIKEATANAGNGDVLSWKIVDDRSVTEAAAQRARDAELKVAGWCDRCQSYCYCDC
jgi:hypothetical protein